jgi:hypothetical protein
MAEGIGAWDRRQINAGILHGLFLDLLQTFKLYIRCSYVAMKCYNHVPVDHLVGCSAISSAIPFCQRVIVKQS